MATAAAAPEVIKRRSGVWTRGLIGLVVAHVLLFTCDRMVANYVDVSALNFVLPDAEIVVLSVATWGFFVSFLWMSRRGSSRRGVTEHKTEKLPKRSAYQPPVRQTQRASQGFGHQRFQAPARAPSPKGSWAEGPNIAEKPQWEKDAGWWLEEIDRAATIADPEAAEAALRGMRKAGIVPQGPAYNSVARTCAMAGSLARAEKWLEYMALVGVTADAATLRALASAHARGGDAAAAEGCHQRLQETEVGLVAAECS